MKREGFKPVGNPLLMGGPVLFSRVGDSGDVSGAFDARNPNSLPIGDWVVAWAYSRLVNTEVNGDGPWDGFDYFIIFHTPLNNVDIYANRGLPSEQLLARPRAQLQVYQHHDDPLNADFTITLSSDGQPDVDFLLRVPTMPDGSVLPRGATFFNRFGTPTTGWQLGPGPEGVSGTFTQITGQPPDLAGLTFSSPLGTDPQLAPWPTGASLQLWNPVTDTEFGAYWDGTAWVSGVAPPPPDPELAVIAFLAGTPGFYFAADKLNTLFQDVTGTVPVTADGEPIGRINCLGGTLVDPSFGNSTVAAHPLYVAPDSAEGDGVDDILNGPTSLFVPATFQEFFVCFDAEVLESNSGALWALGFGGGTSRATVSVNALGQLQLFASRATIPLSAAVMLPGQRKVISAYVDWWTEGRYELRVDGVIVASSLEGPLPPPVDNSTNRHRIFGSTANTPNCVKSRMGRFVFSTKLPSATERQHIEAWVGELL